jgi:Tfp pilus assembly protein FimV
VVHHILGKTDNVEKLTHMQLSADELKAARLPNAKYFKVLQVQGRPSPAPTARAPANKGNVATEDRLAELSNQLRALKNQVKTVEAQNQRLQDEMNAPERQGTAEEQPLERQADAQPDVRLSQ